MKIQFCKNVYSNNMSDIRKLFRAFDHSNFEIFSFNERT